jgi:hypothetical protein
MPDNLIQVGATFDGSQLQAGVASATASINQNLQEMSAGFEAHSARSGEALGGLKLAMEDAGVTVNRHVARWLVELPLVGAAFSLAFPVVAIISFADSLLKADEKMDSHSEKMAKAVRESLDLALSFDKQAESIQISNLKLEDHIATLEKKPAQNGVAIAAMEGRRAVEELVKSFQDAIAKENELLTGQEQGFFNKLLYGDSGINSVVEKAKEFQTQIDETLTKLRLAQAQGNKDQTTEFTSELNTQLEAYKKYLNEQVAENQTALQKRVQQMEKVNRDATMAGREQLMNAQQLAMAQSVINDRNVKGEKALNDEYGKTDQTLRSLLLMLTNFGKTQTELGKHSGLLVVAEDAEKADKALKQLTELNKLFFEMQQQEVKANAAEAEKADKEAIDAEGLCHGARRDR